MEALKRVIGVVLILIAAIVAIHTVIEPVLPHFQRRST